MRKEDRSMNKRIARAAGLAALVLAAVGILTGPSHADDQNNADAAAIYRLQAAFHQAASFGGDINAMMPLWASDATLTVGTTVYSGTDQIRGFFATKAGSFQHYWISLAPSFKTQISVQGDTASLYYECHYADPSVTPYVVRSDVFAMGTLKKVNGNWVFWHMAAGTAPPFPVAGSMVPTPVDLNGQVSDASGANNVDVSAIYRLQAAFHQAASFGGDINLMMPLWASDATLTVGATVYSGTDQIHNFFTTKAGSFQHYWVSLAPSFKTQISVQGDTASLYYECHYADPSVTPYVVRSDVFAMGTLKKVNGNWVFWHMAAGTAPPLAAGAVTPMPGDLNDDGIITTGDAILALRIALGALTPNAAMMKAGDVNGDGKVDVADVVIILRTAIGL